MMSWGGKGGGGVVTHILKDEVTLPVASQLPQALHFIGEDRVAALLFYG